MIGHLLRWLVWCGMKWTEALSVGDAALDEPIQQLFSVAERLRQAICKGFGKVVIGKILDELAQYTVGHFEREERLMLRIEYPDYLAHKAAHDRLINKVQYLQHCFQRGALTQTDALDQFISQHLSEHLLRFDRPLAAASMRA
jgi:hemerythrin